MKIQRRIKRHMKSTLATAVLAAMLTTTPVFALPQNPTVTVGSGQITIDNGAGGILNIGVNANGVIDWSSFSIASGEAVNFNFADTLAVLNRVNGNSMSELNGALNSTGANGSIFLVNPNGVLVGQGAQINASNLVLSTLDVSNENFMNVVSAWRDDNDHTLTFAKGSQQDVADPIIIEGGTFNPMNLKYLGLVGGSITIAPGVTIESNMGDGIRLVAADKAVISLYQQQSGTVEHETNYVASQLANNIVVKGDITSNSIDMRGGTINIAQSNLKTSDLSLYAAQEFTNNDGGNHHIIATKDNTITLANSTVDMTKPNLYGDSYYLKAMGGQVKISDSTVTGGNQVGDAKPQIIITAANTHQQEQNNDVDESYTLTINANQDNTVVLNNVSFTSANDTNNAKVFVLGGKVDIAGSTVKGEEVFIGAGTKLGVEAAYDEANDEYWDEFYFNDYFKSVLGNTVNLGEGTTLVANGEAAIYANAVTNAGTINAHGHYGINIRAVDERNFNEVGNKGYQISSKNNQVINTGVIYADQVNYDSDADPEYGIIGIAASSIDNTGTIEAHRHQDAPWTDKTTGATELLAIGTITGVDRTDESIRVDELNRDLEHYNYKLVWQGEGDMKAPGIVEALPLNGNPTNPTIDEILNGSGSLEHKQQQVIEVINTINNLPASEQATAVVGAISSIQGQASLSKREKESLIGSVVNTYEGTAATKTEANNQITANKASNTDDANIATPTFAANESESNVVIQ